MLWNPMPLKYTCIQSFSLSLFAILTSEEVILWQVVKLHERERSLHRGFNFVL